jgi:hypothetical protein
MHKVSELRNKTIVKTPILYKWWFKKDAALKLITPLLDEISIEKIVKVTANNIEYWMLYVGIGINGHQRLIEYHILDKNKFHERGVINGRLSSLRQTISGLLFIHMSKSKKVIDEFIDSNCLIEFDEVSIEKISTLEKVTIQHEYPVLNYMGTKLIFTKSHRRILTALKKQVKK